MTLKNNSNGSCEKQPVKAIIITGPTASGKTSISLQGARGLGGEILCCDSMQVYKHMNIGTAKPTAEEQQRVPHHLLDLVEPWEEFSVADYCRVAEAVARDVSSRGKIPLFVGGTGLYVTSLVEGYSYETGYQSDMAIRSELEKKAKTQKGLEELYRFLYEHDPEAAAKIHIHNVKRLVRAVELYKMTGQTQQQRNVASKRDGSFLDASVFAVDLDRAALYARINRRVDDMIEEGLIEEVEGLLNLCKERGKSISKTAAQAIGYKETIAYLNGNLDKDAMIEEIKSATRRYAKRQLTWLRKWPWVKWVRPFDCCKNETISDVLSHFSKDTNNFS